MDNTVKKTPLYDIHKAAGGNIVDFAGWALPVQYVGVIEEHRNTRTNASLFDICHMGEIMVTGDEAVPFLQKLLTNDLDRLKVGYCFYSVICNERGKSLDDCFVYKMADDRFTIVVNAANTGKIVSWMESNVSGFKAEVRNLSDAMGKLDLQGPASQGILEVFLGQECSEDSWPRFSFRELQLQDRGLMISRTGYTGEDGFELYMAWDQAPVVWEKLMEAGKDRGLAPAGLGSRDSLRLEACYSLYGHELDEDSTPVESGLGWVVREKACDFFGKDVLLRQKKEGVPRRMVAFEMTERAIPRNGYPLTAGGREVGIVTSGGYGPTLEKNIGLGFIDKAFAEPGTEISVNVRGKDKSAIVVKRPFYTYRGL